MKYDSSDDLNSYFWLFVLQGGNTPFQEACGVNGNMEIVKLFLNRSDLHDIHPQ